MRILCSLAEEFRSSGLLLGINANVQISTHQSNAISTVLSSIT